MSLEIIGIIIHCPKKFEIKVYNRGFVIVENRKIVAIDDETALVETKKRLNVKVTETINLKNSQILIPGFIDTHIHAPQYPNSGLGYDKPLLKWLEAYTYNLEKKFRDQELSRTVFGAIVRKTLDHGTTTACYFASLFGNSSLFVADSAIEFGQRALVGKINMTRLAPDDYRESPEESIENTIKFITDIRSRNSHLVKPVITPRFALSVDMDLMKKLAEIAKNEDLHIQTHISENKDEVEEVTTWYKKPYAEVYDEANLLTPKTILAHGVYLTEEEKKLLADRGTSISHCPASNTCLKSGFCNVRSLVEAGITVGLGTDVSGGPSPSIVEAMRAALSTSTAISFTDETHATLNYSDVFYLATLGGAEALALQDITGNFTIGKDFDALIVDSDVKNGNIDYLMDCTPEELLQKFIYVGDDRNIVKVFVAGKLVKG